MRFLLPVLLSLLTFTTMAQTIDPSGSGVQFRVSNLGMFTVKGTVDGMKGAVSFLADAPTEARFDVCVDAATINTGNNKRDEHLRTADWFDVAKYPKICFRSNTVQTTPEGFLAKGELTMHGETKAVELPFIHTNGILTGTLTVSRLAYGVGADTGTFTVGEEVTVTITCALK
jgi:polyisoprenoid-binding protein YceI